jgi:hypothetical protein
MAQDCPASIRLASFHPLVRYVDEDRALVELVFSLQHSPLPSGGRGRLPREVELRIDVDGSDGFHDELRNVVPIVEGSGTTQVEIVRPHRWWPAGMGSQTLYAFRLTLVVGGEVVDSADRTLGLTSVRPHDRERLDMLLVNGRPYEVHSVINFDHVNERALLPVLGDSLIVVRDHYGTDLLYEAADRAGILMLQCVPIDPNGAPEREVADHVRRLAPHPSLAGWCVGSQGRLSDVVTRILRAMDPVHSVFRSVRPAQAA